MIKLSLPITKQDIKKLKAADEVLLSGILYTARDQAHKRLVDLLKAGKKLPIDLKKSTIYYCGPNPKSRTSAIGSCGPTTSSRMDTLTLPLLKAGLKVTIGKGRRSEEVRRMIKKRGGIYLLAPAGCGALLAQKVISAKVIAFGDLKSEAIYRFEVEGFPVIVGIDSRGRDIFEQ
jgi:fumarate hydratase subunit beta